jgi:hypothetical protein
VDIAAGLKNGVDGEAKPGEIGAIDLSETQIEVAAARKEGAGDPFGLREALRFAVEWSAVINGNYPGMETRLSAH